MRRRLGVAAVVLGMVGCDEVTVNTDATGQEYLFDVSYRSTAFFFYWVGIVVLEDGSIVAYDREDDWPAQDSPTYSLDDLEDRYASNRRVIGQVPLDELQDRVNQLAKVADEYSSPNIACNDGGMVTYSGYTFDPGTERYTQVVVRDEGERPRQNTSTEGILLSAWLMELARETDIEELSLFHDSFCVP